MYPAGAPKLPRRPLQLYRVEEHMNLLMNMRSQVMFNYHLLCLHDVQRLMKLKGISWYRGISHGLLLSPHPRQKDSGGVAW